VEEIVNNIFSVSPSTFIQQALNTFRYQYDENKIYHQWVNVLNININEVTKLSQIPFLPVSFFKDYQVITGKFEPEVIFTSSGTTGTVSSKHIVRQIELYKQSFTEGFKKFYNNPEDWCIIGLLPSYLERKGSSLVMMVEELIKLSGHNKSGFYLNEFEELANVLKELEAQKQKTLLIGVTFALLDFAERFSMQLQNTIIIETGGMKGRRKEMVREDVHSFLQKQFNVFAIHSEYGMTELLSQAYSSGSGVYNNVPWMKVLVRDEDDPLSITEKGRGLINVIDLANVHSCSFIATDDVGRIFEDGSFEVSGRRDNSDIRGCSLMAI